MKPPSEFPYEIRTAEDARIIGEALTAVHFDPGWAPRVFAGDPSFNRNTGPAVLREELRSMWQQWSLDERRQIMTIFTTERLK